MTPTISEHDFKEIEQRDSYKVYRDIINKKDLEKNQLAKKIAYNIISKFVDYAEIESDLTSVMFVIDDKNYIKEIEGVLSSHNVYVVLLKNDKTETIGLAISLYDIPIDYIMDYKHPTWHKEDIVVADYMQ